MSNDVDMDGGVSDEGAEIGGGTVAERLEREAERIAEALVFASAQPVSEAFIAERIEWMRRDRPRCDWQGEPLPNGGTRVTRTA